jgi:fructan beta-fructosidase
VKPKVETRSNIKIPLKAKTMKIEKRYLQFSIKTGAPKHWLFLKAGDQVLREFEIELAQQPYQGSDFSQGCDFWAFLDVSAWLGQELSLSAEPPITHAILDVFPQSDEPLYTPSDVQKPHVPETTISSTLNLYQEQYRPQFHFSPRRGWMNDPNGLVYYQGEYHLFFQHNPYGVAWGNMHWGHAVSPDLLHWRELPEALYPDARGTIFSGSGVVDWHNTAGLQSGPLPALVFFYTAAGNLTPSSKGQPFTQCLAYSNDGGQTLCDYAHNPILAHIIKENRDPKLVWHSPSKHWIMALYKDENEFALFSSPDLKTWSHLHDLTMPGCSECPDFFELPIEDEPGQARWVFTAANGRYLLGSFDGLHFSPETGPLQVDFGANYYAVQTYSDIPDSRRIQLAWMAGGSYPSMPFNQQMSFPCELKLRRFPEGLRLCRTPIQEINLLHTHKSEWKGTSIHPGDNPLADIPCDLFELRVDINPGSANSCSLVVRGERITYSTGDKILTCLGHTAPLDLHGGHLELHILLDRTSMEVFANDGRVSFTSCCLPAEDEHSLAVYIDQGQAFLNSLSIAELSSTW